MDEYDVFLSHHPDDLALVKEVAQQLQEDDVTVFLDHWDVIPGRLRQESLEAGLGASRNCAVFVGPGGLGPEGMEEGRRQGQGEAQSAAKARPFAVDASVQRSRGLDLATQAEASTLDLVPDADACPDVLEPSGLLARAVLRRFRGDLDGASADLAEAGEIAERGHMRLHECDVHLEGTRQCLVHGDVRGAGERLAAARGIVEATGPRTHDRIQARNLPRRGRPI